MDRRTVFGVVAAGLLAGCARKPWVPPTLASVLSLRPVADKTSVDMAPAIGSRATAAVGSPMVKAAEVRWREGFSLENLTPVSWLSDVDYVLTATPPPGWFRLAHTGSDGSQYLEEVKVKIRGTYKGKPYDENTMLGSYRLDLGGAVALLLRYDEDDVILTNPIPGATFVRSVQRAPVGERQFRRELVYTGRSGDSISILYREFSDDLARPAFSQQLQYDIGRDPVIGFQGAQLRILSATNSDVSYEVLSAMAAP